MAGKTGGNSSLIGAPKIVVVGSLNLDFVVPVERHPLPGETLLGGHYFLNPGGKGANQAVAAARLGQRVAMVGRVGEDVQGRRLIEALTIDGIDVEHVLMSRQKPTGAAFVQVSPSGENSIVVSPGANSALTPADVEKSTGLLGTAAVLLLQLEVPVEAVSKAASLANGVVILNPAPAVTLPTELLRRVDVLVPNQSELATLTGAVEPTDVGEVERLAKKIEGPRAVVVTLGNQGALLVTPAETRHFPAPALEVVDTTAAGDCFCGALADAIARNQALPKAVGWAVQAASTAVTRRGAQKSLPRREEVLRVKVPSRPT